MGQGGFITLHNHTTRDWVRTAQDTYQMHAWHAPEKVGAGAEVRFYLEWKQSMFINPCDDSAYATYQMEGTGVHFKVRAQASGGYSSYSFNTFVELQTLTLNDIRSDTCKMGWVHDGNVDFTMYEYEGGYYFFDPQVAALFFTANYGLLHDKPLNQIAMAGSHDAGMYVLNGGTMGVSPSNTLTQSLSIYDQLTRGARYFDLRPVIGNGGKLMAGHYSGRYNTGVWKGRFGGNGAPLKDIVDDINQFTSRHGKELVVVELSHAYNTDSGYNEMTDAEWDRVFAVMAGIQARITKSALAKGGLPASNLGALTLEQLLAHGQVIIRCDGSYSGTLADHVFPKSSLDLYDDYADTHNKGKMISDQLEPV